LRFVGVESHTPTEVVEDLGRNAHVASRYVDAASICSRSKRWARDESRDRACEAVDTNRALLVIAILDLGHAERSPQHPKTGEDLVESTLSASEQERAEARGPFAFLLITSSS